MRGFRALGVSVTDGDQTGPDECAPARFQSRFGIKGFWWPACGAVRRIWASRWPTATRPAPTNARLPDSKVGLDQGFLGPTWGAVHRLGVSVANGDQTGPDECAPCTPSHLFQLASIPGWPAGLCIRY